MAAEALMVTLSIDGEIDQDFATRVSEATRTETRAIEKHSLNGDAESWMVIGKFAVEAATALIPLVTAYLQSRRVKSIKVGDVTIENPTAKEVEDLLASQTTHADGSK